eukprot:81678_1
MADSFWILSLIVHINLFIINSACQFKIYDYADTDNYAANNGWTRLTYANLQTTGAYKTSLIDFLNANSLRIQALSTFNAGNACMSYGESEFIVWTSTSFLGASSTTSCSYGGNYVQNNWYYLCDYQTRITSMSYSNNFNRKTSCINSKNAAFYRKCPTPTGPTPTPTSSPTPAPTHAPIKLATSTPTKVPTSVPTKIPTKIPTSIPSTIPTKIPTSVPTINPSISPSKTPTIFPSKILTKTPTNYPSFSPTASSFTTYIPTILPSFVPTFVPTFNPTLVPTVIPTCNPTIDPSKYPTLNPTHPDAPSNIPTSIPITGHPSIKPSFSPSNLPSIQPTVHPSNNPSNAPIILTENPTINPTYSPISIPTYWPTKVLTKSPSNTPTIHSTNQTLPTIITSSDSLSTSTLAQTIKITSDKLGIDNTVPNNVLYIYILTGAVGLCVILSILMFIIICLICKKNRTLTAETSNLQMTRHQRFESDISSINYSTGVNNYTLVNHQLPVINDVMAQNNLVDDALRVPLPDNKESDPDEMYEVVEGENQTEDIYM